MPTIKNNVSITPDGSSVNDPSWTNQTYASNTDGGLGSSPIAAPTLAEVATIYVTTNGSDSNNGLSWTSAKATVNAALAALPVSNGQTMGVVQLGYGGFAPFTISDTMTVTVKGMGLGQVYDSSNNINTPQQASYINNTGTGVGVTIQGPSTFGSSGGPVPCCVQLSDFAIIGNSSSSDGLYINKTEGILLRNMIIDSCATWGLHIEQLYGLEVDNLSVLRCGTSGASGFSGGVYLDASEGQNNDFIFTGCNFDENHGEGFYSVNGTAMLFVSCDFEANLATARSGSGSGFTLGNSGANYPYTFLDCWFENNAKYGANINGSSTHTVVNFTGCQFPGDSTQIAGINMPGAVVVNVTGCTFQAHTSGYSILNTGGNAVNWTGCWSSDATGFIEGYTGLAGQNIPIASSIAIGSQQSCIIGTASPQTLASNGAVTMNGAFGNVFINTLNANATSSSITNPSAGQTITISWIQGTGGSFTYAWPTNCKFAAGSAPSASSTATYRDSVTFYYDGVAGNWYEVSRAVGVH